MLVDPNFWVNVALLLLISPGNTISFGPIFAAFEYSTPLSRDLSAASLARLDTPLPAVGDGLDSAPQVGGLCAHKSGDSPSASSAIPKCITRHLDIPVSPYHGLRCRGSFSRLPAEIIVQL